MQAKDRRAAIRSLLTQEEVANQAELIEQLEARGVLTTQPVASRDLRALGAVKRGGVYVLLEGERVTPLDSLRSLLRDAEMAGPHMLVIRCEPGAASAVARAVEAEEPDGLVGTVAGDDTIHAAVSSKSAGLALARRVRALL
jgi:transcriptional regulator of arginine metabolism